MDNNEQIPWTFQGIRSDARTKNLPFLVATRRISLHTGDYTLDGLGSLFTIERKSKTDLYQTLSHGRDRFTDELNRMNQLRFSAVLVEADWTDLLHNPPEMSGFHPKSVYRSVVAWQVRFPKVQWWFCPGRRFAELTAFRLLQRCEQEHGSCLSTPTATSSPP